MNGKGQSILLSLIWMAAAALLLGQAVWQPVRETAVVKRCEPETLRLAGDVVCQGTGLPAKGGAWYALLRDGQRAAAGQTLYVSEKPLEAEARQARVLQAAYAASRQPVTVQDKALQKAVATLARAQDTGRTAAAEALTATVLAMGTPKSAGMAPDGNAGRCVTAPVSGIFVSDPTGKTMGSIITGDAWSVTLPPAFFAEVGQTVEAELLSGIFRTVELTVEEAAETGLRLSCDEALEEAACMETITVKIKKETGSGLEIPARAVYTEEGETGVWCLAGDSVRWKPITVLRETEDTVIAALDAGNTANLLPGDIVLLEDGRK